MKELRFLVILALIVGVFAGCAPSTDEADDAADDGMEEAGDMMDEGMEGDGMMEEADTMMMEEADTTMMMDGEGDAMMDEGASDEGGEEHP
ncbi:MAG: hypothetical protein OXM02_14005 [Bacteroidota bacterium]|nr:hypothetical protein [Bacteroidota bacterium]MDE2835612.1 hypothetical protein [Bacteroidota bacterium]MDE2956552.1 hypothetical protein [Bacteroidota bacterium]